MQTITSREAQVKFGAFAREAQKEAVIVTNHGNPIFLAIPVKITASVAELIQRVSPATPEEVSVRLEHFFARLAERQSGLEVMDDDARAAFIKDPD